ncbi:MAG: hypothetical protein WC781_05720 [Candidatus Pacearchaeota archaeon]|jgi:hypothetical protein
MKYKLKIYIEKEEDKEYIIKKLEEVIQKIKENKVGIFPFGFGGELK